MTEWCYLGLMRKLYPYLLHTQPQCLLCFLPRCVPRKIFPNMACVWDVQQMCAQTAKAVTASVVIEKDRELVPGKLNSSQGRKNKHWKKTRSCQNRWPKKLLKHLMTYCYVQMASISVFSRKIAINRQNYHFQIWLKVLWSHKG